MNQRSYFKEPDVSWRSIEGQAVLIHNLRGEIRVLNQTGTVVWEHLEEGVDAIVARLAETYDVDPETARRDVEELIRELIEFGAIRAKDQQQAG